MIVVGALGAHHIFEVACRLRRVNFGTFACSLSAVLIDEAVSSRALSSDQACLPASLSYRGRNSPYRVTGLA